MFDPVNKGGNPYLDFHRKPGICVNILSVKWLDLPVTQRYLELDCCHQQIQGIHLKVSESLLSVLYCLVT